MCGIVGYIGKQESGSDHSGRAEAPGISRLRFGRAWPCAASDDQLAVRRASGKLRNLEEAIRLNPVDGAYRHRPYALGHAWPAHRRERASASRLHGRHRRGAQRHRRELPGAEATACSRKATSSKPRPIRKSSRTWWRSTSRAIWKRPCAQAVKELTGVFALAVIARSDPNKIVAARQVRPW